LIEKKFRLKSLDLSYLLDKGEQTTSKLFIIRYSESKESYPRFACIVSRKLAPKAVERNKLRRRVYEAIRLIIKEEKTTKNIDYALIPKKNILNKDQNEIKEDLRTIILSHG